MFCACDCGAWQISLSALRTALREDKDEDEGEVLEEVETDEED